MISSTGLHRLFCRNISVRVLIGLLVSCGVVESSVVAQDKKTKENRKASRASEGGDSEYKQITFDDIKLDTEAGADYDPELITDEIKKLDKKKVQLRGFMLPGNAQTGIKGFFLVRDNQECCFGPNAAIHDCVMVALKKGTETSFTVRPVTVEGTFHLHEVYQGRKEGRPSAIYVMTKCKVTK